MEDERRGALELQRPRVEGRETVVGEFLFGETRQREKSEVLVRMWRRRRRVEPVCIWCKKFH